MTLSMPKIFKEQGRYSETKRPEIGGRVLFSPSIQLTVSEVVPFYRSCMGGKLTPVSTGVCKGNTMHLILVLFDNLPTPCLVSPSYLTSYELTTFGKALFQLS